MINVHRLTFPFVLPQVFPKAEMEAHLAGRLKYHAENREALRKALNTYLNHGEPVPDDGGGIPAVSTWNDNIEED